jgi:8-amino-7-oxononanoate synthase
MQQIAEKLRDYRQKALFRELREINRDDGRIINTSYINFSSNDYLGISKSDRVKQAFIAGVNLYGFGSGSSALISGYYSSVSKLEKRFAEILGREQALFFSSGYQANIGIIQALSMNIIMDKLSHASIIDGARLSGKKFFRYQHNNLVNAEKLLQENSLLISERVFSMEGNITDVNALVKLSKKYKSLSLIDDAHGFGILANDIKSDLLVIPLGKALGGMGAIVAGSNDLIDYLRQFSRSYVYSTALPPAIACANLAALEVMIEETWRLAKLKHLIGLFDELAKKLGLKLAAQASTPIKAVIIGDNLKAKNLEKKLYKHGFFIKAIIPPTVKEARLRISICAYHEEEDIKQLLERLVS